GQVASHPHIDFFQQCVREIAHGRVERFETDQRIEEPRLPDVWGVTEYDFLTARERRSHMLQPSVRLRNTIRIRENQVFVLRCLDSQRNGKFFTMLQSYVFSNFHGLEMGMLCTQLL